VQRVVQYVREFSAVPAPVLIPTTGGPSHA
jgi:hypothetical protein